MSNTQKNVSGVPNVPGVSLYPEYLETVWYVESYRNLQRSKILVGRMDMVLLLGEVSKIPGDKIDGGNVLLTRHAGSGKAITGHRP